VRFLVLRGVEAVEISDTCPLRRQELPYLRGVRSTEKFGCDLDQTWRSADMVLWIRKTYGLLHEALFNWVVISLVWHINS